jgi:transposase
VGERQAGESPSREELRELLRLLVDERRTDDVLALFFETIDRISEAHARTLLELKQAIKARYGRRSEKLDDEQLELLAEMVWDMGKRHVPDREVSQPELEVDESQPRDPAKPRPQKKARGRKPLPPELPREEVVIPVPQREQVCPGCGAEREVIGHEPSEVLEYTPATFRVKQIRREKRACARCKRGVVCAPPAPKVHERGLYGPGLIAQVLVSKFKDHLPLYRQRQIYKRAGVDLPRSTLGDAVAGATQLLRPVAERIREQILATDLVQSDDTGLRVLDRDHPQRIKRGVLWPYLAGELAYFDYTPTRAGAGPQAFLADYRGYLQVDGYSGYDRLFEEGSGRVEVGCWAHARRYFIVAMETGDLRAAEMVAHVQRLYRIEKQAREEGRGPPERQALRVEAAAPVLEEIRTWLEKMAPVASPKSPLGRAIPYTQKRLAALRRYLDDGRLEIDNNGVERLVRLVAVGRKNYLFAGSDAGAERAATAYTLIATCALHEIDPWAYLADVLEKIACGWPQRALDQLLPAAWAADHPDALRCDTPA